MWTLLGSLKVCYTVGLLEVFPEAKIMVKEGGIKRCCVHVFKTLAMLSGEVRLVTPWGREGC